MNRFKCVSVVCRVHSICACYVYAICFPFLYLFFIRPANKTSTTLHARPIRKCILWDFWAGFPLVSSTQNTASPQLSESVSRRSYNSITHHQQSSIFYIHILCEISHFWYDIGIAKHTHTHHLCNSSLVSIFISIYFFYFIISI